MMHRQQSPDASPHQTPLHTSPTLTSKLLLLSRGYGTSSTSLSLAACLSPSHERLPTEPGTLRFEFYDAGGKKHNIEMSVSRQRRRGAMEPR